MTLRLVLRHTYKRCYYNLVAIRREYLSSHKVFDHIFALCRNTDVVELCALTAIKAKVVRSIHKVTIAIMHERWYLKANAISKLEEVLPWVHLQAVFFRFVFQIGGSHAASSPELSKHRTDVGRIYHRFLFIVRNGQRAMHCLG